MSRYGSAKDGGLGCRLSTPAEVRPKLSVPAEATLRFK